jgi:hypothetical protein
MDKIVDALKTHLLDAVRAVVQPRTLIEEVLSRNSRMSDSLFIFLQLVLAGVATAVPRFQDASSLSPAAPFIFFVHLTLLTVLVQLSCKLLRANSSIEVSLAFALISLGTLLFVGLVGYMIALSSLKLLQPEHYHWLTANSMSNFMYFAINDPQNDLAPESRSS